MIIRIYRMGYKELTCSAVLSFCVVLLCTWIPDALSDSIDDVKGKSVKCTDLRMGQYLCNLTTIDPATQQLIGCTQEGKANVSCRAVDGLKCRESGSRDFEMEVECQWTNGTRYDVALLLSVFMGIFGGDRFYLGHFGMGALKFCTLGFLFIGQLVDIILIATQTIGPKDGSTFIVGYYGPAITPIRPDNLTYIVPRLDWN